MKINKTSLLPVRIIESAEWQLLFCLAANPSTQFAPYTTLQICTVMLQLYNFHAEKRQDQKGDKNTTEKQNANCKKKL